MSSVADGVGNIITAVARLGPHPPPRSDLGWSNFSCQLSKDFSGSVAHGVGQDPESFAAMTGPNVVSSEHVPDCIEPAFGQVTEHGPEVAVPLAEESWHVFQERDCWSYFANDPDCVRPSVAFVLRALLFAGDRERLAREPRTNDVHQIPKRASIERAAVAPDREFADACVSLSGDEGLSGVHVELDGSDDLSPKKMRSENAAPSS